MTRLLLALAGVLLLALSALGALWLAGELLLGLGLAAVGTANVLFKLLGFLLGAGVLGGLVYFVASAWRPEPAAPLPPADGAEEPLPAVTVLTAHSQLLRSDADLRL